MEGKTKFKNWLLSIEAEANEKSPTLEELRGYQSALLECVDFLFVATIIHDQDFKDNGEARKSHAHAFLELTEGKTTKQVLNLLKTALKCKEEQLSVEPTNSEILGIQYLTHKNQPKKAQYSIDLVRTTNTEKLLERYGKTYEKPQSEEDLLREGIQASKTLWELAQKIGFAQANKYRTMFNQIKQEEAQNFDAIAKERDKFLEAFKEAKEMLYKVVRLYRKNALFDRDIQEVEAYLEYSEDLPF